MRIWPEYGLGLIATLGDTSYCTIIHDQLDLESPRRHRSEYVWVVSKPLTEKAKPTLNRGVSITRSGT